MAIQTDIDRQIDRERERERETEIDRYRDREGKERMKNDLSLSKRCWCCAIEEAGQGCGG